MVALAVWMALSLSAPREASAEPPHARADSPRFAELPGAATKPAPRTPTGTPPPPPEPELDEHGLDEPKPFRPHAGWGYVSPSERDALLPPDQLDLHWQKRADEAEHRYRRSRNILLTGAGLTTAVSVGMFATAISNARTAGCLEASRRDTCTTQVRPAWLAAGSVLGLASAALAGAGGYHAGGADSIRARSEDGLSRQRWLPVILGGGLVAVGAGTMTGTLSALAVGDHSPGIDTALTVSAMCGSLATTLGAFALGYGLGYNQHADPPRHKRLSVLPTPGGLSMSF